MPIARSDIAQNIHEFIVEEVMEDDDELDYDDNLLMEVGVDSMGMLRLVGFIELEYSLKISPSFFTIENFENINTVSAFVELLITEQT